MKQLHLGKQGKEPLEGHSSAIWHSNDGGKTYWTGLWCDRTPKHLKEEAESVLSDLRKMHPEVFTGVTQSKDTEHTNKPNEDMPKKTTSTDDCADHLMDALDTQVDQARDHHRRLVLEADTAQAKREVVLEYLAKFEDLRDRLRDMISEAKK